MKIIIPARLGSKGLPFKNRILFRYTADIIPVEYRIHTWVTTDDLEIVEMAKEYKFNIIIRPTELGEDTTSIREVMYHAVNSAKIQPNDIVTMLYLTYPGRTWDEVSTASEFFLSYYQEGWTESLLCKKEAKSHPYLCMYERGLDGIFGRSIVDHDECRRQDYPTCFEISHYIAIFRAGALHTLNRNLYCDTTVFYSIGEVIDVDSKKELSLVV